MLWRKQQFTSGWNVFLRKRKCHWWRKIRAASNKQNWRKHCKNSSNCVWKSSAVRSIAEQMNTDRETVRKILTEDLDMRKVCAKMVPKKLTEEEKQTRVTICQDLFERQYDILGCVFTGDEIWVYQYDPETKRAKCTMEDCQFPMTKKIPSVQIKSQKNVEFFILEGLSIVKL